MGADSSLWEDRPNSLCKAVCSVGHTYLCSRECEELIGLELTQVRNKLEIRKIFDERTSLCSVPKHAAMQRDKLEIWR